MQPLGLYLAIPFCRAKCSFCNFASDAFAPGRLPAYVDALLAELQSSRARAESLPASLPQQVDTIYLGGGTPSLLAPPDVRRIFNTSNHHFDLHTETEITVECAPGQLSDSTLEELLRHGANRLSFGVQSFNLRETSAIGRTHTPEQAVAELDRMRSAGVLNLSIDLIAGLPHQTEASWRHSIETAIETGVPHISVYMLEIDDDSRLGREVLAQGARYGAPAVPSDDQAADFYEIACGLLNRAGILQYEISNFARPGFQSVHNRKYWERKPYLGLGLDAHSMLRTSTGPVRFANTDDLDAYLQKPSLLETGPDLLPLLTPDNLNHHVTSDEAFEEALFLGLRLTEGVSLEALTAEFGPRRVESLGPALADAAQADLVNLDPEHISLTPRGRVLSNEVFSRLLTPSVV